MDPSPARRFRQPAPPTSGRQGPRSARNQDSRGEVRTVLGTLSSQPDSVRSALHSPAMARQKREAQGNR